MQKKLTNDSQKYFLKRNDYFITSNIAYYFITSNIAYYYTLYTLECLIDEIQIFYFITTFHFLIIFFKLVSQTVEKQGKQ